MHLCLCTRRVGDARYIERTGLRYVGTTCISTSRGQLACLPALSERYNGNAPDVYTSQSTMPLDMSRFFSCFELFYRGRKKLFLLRETPDPDCLIIRFLRELQDGASTAFIELITRWYER